MSIQSEINRISGAKSAIATAIENKGVTVPSGTKLDGMAGLISNIEQGGSAPNLQSKSVTYTSNGTATVTPDSGYDGLSSVDVTVDVSGGGGSEGGGSLDTCTVILKATVGTIQFWVYSYNNNGFINTGFCDNINELWKPPITIENVLCGSFIRVSASGAEVPYWITDGAERVENTFEPIGFYKITASPGGTATLTYIDND